MVGWLDGKLNRHEFAQAPGFGKGQGSLACCSPWGRKQLDMTEQQNNKSFMPLVLIYDHCYPFTCEWTLCLFPVVDPYFQRCYKQCVEIFWCTQAGFI